MGMEQHRARGQGHLYRVDRPIAPIDSKALSAQLNAFVAARKLQCNVGCMTNLVALLESRPLEPNRWAFSKKAPRMSSTRGWTARPNSSAGTASLHTR